MQSQETDFICECAKPNWNSNYDRKKNYQPHWLHEIEGKMEQMLTKIGANVTVTLLYFTSVP